MNFLISSLCLICIAAAGAAAPTAGRAGQAPSRFEYVRLLMGVRTRIVLYAPNEAAAERACAAAFERIAALEAVMSDYRPDSELMRLCAKAGGPPVPVSDDLYHILERAGQLAERTDGAFDPTVGPLIALWRSARKSGRLPAAEELERARALCGRQKVCLDPKAKRVQLLVPGMRLDLGGIGKGFACDAAQAMLKRHGIRQALVEAGGDIVVSGAPPGTAGWRILVPGAGPNGSARQLVLADRAVSTSGDVHQFVEIDGVRYSHIVDPRTGLGLTTRIAATILAPDGTTSDGLSTAVSVLGPERGQALADATPGVTAYITHAEAR